MFGTLEDELDLPENPLDDMDKLVYLHKVVG